MAFSSRERSHPSLRMTRLPVASPGKLASTRAMSSPCPMARSTCKRSGPSSGSSPINIDLLQGKLVGGDGIRPEDLLARRGGEIIEARLGRRFDTTVVGGQQAHRPVG